MKKAFLLLFAVIFVMPLMGEEFPHIELFPNEVEMNVGDTTIFYVKYVDTNGVSIDTTANFFVNPKKLGDIDENGVFISSNQGEGFIRAKVGNLFDSVSVKIEEIENDDEIEKIKLKIVTSGKSVFLGDTTEFAVQYCDSLGNEIDTVAIWEVLPDTIGEFINSTQFVAYYPGEATIIATLSELSDTLTIEIKEPLNFEQYHDLYVSPKDTVVDQGATFQYTAYQQNGESLTDVTSSAIWNLEGMNVGTIGTEGLFSAENPGFGLIATVDTGMGTSLVIVENGADTVTNTITITRDHSSSKKEYRVIKTLEEGERWVIAGMPAPLNIYNGGMIYFPNGSLKEDVRIHISLPEFIKEVGDSTKLPSKSKKMLNAINFQVFVEDTVLSEPYYFETPLIVSLVYKRGLLKQYDIDPLDLNLYYVSNDSNNLNPDTSGISNTVLDYFHNTIYSQVAHFSTLAIMGEASATDINDDQNITSVPEKFELYQNYPNPFNPTTTVKFKILEPGQVKIDIYNILGKKVEELINNDYAVGTYAINWNAGDLSSGIYFIKMKYGNNSKIIRSLLLK